MFHSHLNKIEIPIDVRSLFSTREIIFELVIVKAAFVLHLDAANKNVSGHRNVDQSE